MERPLIAIVGSADTSREYQPPIPDMASLQAACEEIGRELATHNCDIVVYSSEPGFIEAHVVRGYVGSGLAPPKSIQVRYPLDAGMDFPEFRAEPALFDPRPDDSPDWEVSFYRSLAKTQGVVLAGGGRSTHVTGLIALAYRLPVLVLASFGGSARKVWEALNRDPGTATEEEVAAMAYGWHTESASGLVAALSASRKRHLAVEQQRERASASYRRRLTASAVAGALMLMLGIAAIPLSWNWSPGTGGALAVLLFTPLLTGASGSIMRNVSDLGRDPTRTAIMGLTAGGVAFLLFVAAQIAATPDILDTAGSRRLLVFGLPTSFIAGLTFDAVYDRLRKRDALSSPAEGTR